ncbi:MAG: hypothetical protein JSW05_09585 [Candidatus Thorarchaeota archaeon]|nr:MAG: hypothetical protein JSW05_09585 [Candidatus Thorarchaeota archaeon]
MKPWLMEILICPMKECRSELHLDVFEKHTAQVDGKDFEEIDEALITCTNCNRWYPVIGGIPCMLPDDLRMTGTQRKAEDDFLRRWRERIPSEILEKGIPFGLVTES